MLFRDWLANWNLSSLKLSVGFLETEWRPDDQDRLAAWDLYVEMLTRVITQPLDDTHGDEAVALESVQSMFSSTREILKVRGPGAIRFAQLAVVVLNQVVRPFTAKWHRLRVEGAFEADAQRSVFRAELAELQITLSRYASALADLAGVEDMSKVMPEGGSPTDAD